MNEGDHFTVNMRNFHSLSLRTNYTHMWFTPTFHPFHSTGEGNEFVEKVIIDIKTRIFGYWHARRECTVDTRTLNQSLCRRGFVDGQSWKSVQTFSRLPLDAEKFLLRSDFCLRVKSGIQLSQNLNFRRRETKAEVMQELYQVFLKGTQVGGEWEIRHIIFDQFDCNRRKVCSTLIIKSSRNQIIAGAIESYQWQIKIPLSMISLPNKYQISVLL